MTFLKWIIGVPLVVIAIAFAVANGGVVSFYWSPIHPPIEWPLYALVLLAMIWGFVLGSLMTWVAGHGVRRERSALKAETKKQQAEIETLQESQMRSDTLQEARHNLPSKEIY